MNFRICNASYTPFHSVATKTKRNTTMTRTMGRFVTAGVSLTRGDLKFHRATGDDYTHRMRDNCMAFSWRYRCRAGCRCGRISRSEIVTCLALLYQRETESVRDVRLGILIPKSNCVASRIWTKLSDFDKYLNAMFLMFGRNFSDEDINIYTGIQNYSKIRFNVTLIIMLAPHVRNLIFDYCFWITIPYE